MKRATLIKIHLYFSGIILIFLSLTALSGALHLLSGDEAEQVTEVSSFMVPIDISKEELTKAFKTELELKKEEYRFDYIKGSSTSLTSRPTTRTYYTFKVEKGVATFREHIPSLRMRLMELHKGHGPRSSRNILGILGLLAIGALLSGLWLGISSPALRKVSLATVFSGAFVYALLFFL